MAELLYNLWYVAAPARELKRGKTVAKTILGVPMLLGRDAEGQVFALRDFCPHRGMPLRYGCFDGKEIECCYHGWKFNTDGQCTLVPSLTPEDNKDISRIKTQSFPCREVDGAIWVYVPAPGARVPDILPNIPPAPTALGHPYHWVTSVLFPCGVDDAVIGLMDPSHGPFVHASWWWRSRGSIHTKEKKFAPRDMGFTMVSHRPSSNSRAYKLLLGGQPETEISFQLPSLRTEHIVAGKHHIVLLTALTPIDENQTVLHQFMYSTIPLLNALKGVLGIFGKAFIKQDLETVRKQQEGLRGNHPSLMLLGDADAQALWYFKLKKEYLESQQNQVPFENTLREKVLRWRS